MSETTTTWAPAGARFVVRWGAATDVGRHRSVNEDSLLAAPPVFVVADGMGGHARGDEASRRAVAAFGALAGRADVGSGEIVATVQAAASAVRAIGGPGAPGTTVTGVALTRHDGVPWWLVFNVGDSRTYRYADGELEQVSIDHTRVQELVDEGRLAPLDARFHEERHVITRALGAGVAAPPVVDRWLIAATPGERLLVCSDGLTSELDDAEIGRLLTTVPDPQEAATALVAAAVAAGGHDNVTAIVVETAAADSSGSAGATDAGQTARRARDEEPTHELPVVRLPDGPAR